MNIHGNDPLFWLVGDLVDGQSNIADDGKIIELFDAGCDALAPGATLEETKNSVVISERDVTDTRKNYGIPPVRRTLGPSLQRRRDEQKNRENQKSNISAGGRIKSKVESLKTGGTLYEAKTTTSRSWMSEEYGKNSTPKLDSTIYEMDGTRQARVTSDASLSPESVQTFVSRAVDKDSLSNCSRQLEVLKIFEGDSDSPSKIGSKDSRLPSSCRITKVPKSDTINKMLSSRKSYIGASHVTRNEKEIIRPDTDDGMSLMKVTGDTDQEFLEKPLNNPEINSRTNSDGILKQRWHCADGETISKITLDKGSDGTSRKNLAGVIKSPTIPSKICTFGNPRSKGISAVSASASNRRNITSSKLPQSRFGSRNSSIGCNKVRQIEEENVVEQSAVHPRDVFDGKKSKSNSGLFSKIKFDDRKALNDKPSINLAKASAHRSTVNSFNCNSTKLPRPKISMIAPKLMNEFVKDYQENDPSDEKLTQSGPKDEPTKVKTDIFGTVERSKKENTFPDRVKETSVSKTSDNDGIRIFDEVETKNKREGVEIITVKTQGNQKKPISETSTSFRLQKPRMANQRKAPNTLSPSFSKQSKVPRPVTLPTPILPGLKPDPAKEIGRNSSARTRPIKKKSTIRQGFCNKSNSEAVKKKSTSSTQELGSTETFETEGEDGKGRSTVFESSVKVPKDDEDEELIPIMNSAAFYNNIRSFATPCQNQKNNWGQFNQIRDAAPTNTGKMRSWIDGHEHAYLRGRAIGMKVAIMAKAAKQEVKKKFIRSGLESLKPVSRPKKSQEIIDIALSVIENVVAEKARKLNPSSVRRRDSPKLEYELAGFQTINDQWNNTQWLL